MINRKVATEVDKKQEYDKAMRDMLNSHAQPMSKEDLAAELKAKPSMAVDIVTRPEPEVKQPQGVSEARQQGEPPPMGMPPRVGVDAAESPRVLVASHAEGKRLGASKSLSGWACRCRRCVDFKRYSPGGPERVRCELARRPSGSDGGLAPITDETACTHSNLDDAGDADAAGIAPKAEAAPQGKGTVSKPNGGGEQDDLDQEFRGLLQVWTQDLKAEAEEHKQAIMQLTQRLGGNASKYRRERRAKLKAIVMELYSPLGWAQQPDFTLALVLSQVQRWI